MPDDRSLPRSERLRSLGAVRRLFECGESGFVFPFRYVWYAEPDTEPSVEVLFTVPKKFHKRANRRNLLRRRTLTRVATILVLLVVSTAYVVGSTNSPFLYFNF